MELRNAIEFCNRWLFYSYQHQKILTLAELRSAKICQPGRLIGWHCRMPTSFSRTDEMHLDESFTILLWLIADNFTPQGENAGTRLFNVFINLSQYVLCWTLLILGISIRSKLFLTEVRLNVTVYWYRYSVTTAGNPCRREHGQHLAS